MSVCKSRHLAIVPFDNIGHVASDASSGGQDDTSIEVTKTGMNVVIMLKHKKG